MHSPGRLKWKGTTNQAHRYITPCTQTRDTCTGSAVMGNYSFRTTSSAAFVKQTKTYCSSKPDPHAIKTEQQLQKRNVSSKLSRCPLHCCRLLTKSSSLSEEQAAWNHHSWFHQQGYAQSAITQLTLTLHCHRPTAVMGSGAGVYVKFTPKFIVNAFHWVKKKFSQN